MKNSDVKTNHQPANLIDQNHDTRVEFENHYEILSCRVAKYY